MKVLHLISGGDTGGAKTHVLSLVGELQKTIPVRLACFMEGPFLTEARELGLDTLLLKQKGRADLSVLNELVDVVRRDRFDILHAHGARANLLVALVKRRLGIPCLTTVHSDYRLDFIGNIYKTIAYTPLNSIALRFFDYYVTVAGPVRDVLVKRGFPRDRIFSVNNGIDFDLDLRLPSRAEALAMAGLNIPPDAPIIGAVGRLALIKDYPTFIRAAAAVHAEFPDVHFMIIGDGEERQRLADLVAQLDVVDRVHFAGYHDNPNPLMSTLAVNVLTSRNEGGLPYVLLEGARLGLATVSTTVGGVRDLISADETGLLFDPGDDAALSRHLIALLRDPERRTRLGDNIRARAREHFSLRRMAEQQLDIYRHIVRED
ncbi:MAG: glycosyltransferase family 4 protein [Chloroflexota bacterium]